MYLTSSPKQPLDIILWPTLRVAWEPFTLKRSHFWHWIAYNKTPEFIVSVPVDESASPRHQSQWHNFFQTNFGWKKIAILRPKQYSGSYRCGFISQEGAVYKKEICALILQGPVAVLLSPYEFKFFAESYPENAAVELELIETTTKDKLPKNIPLI